MFSEMPPWLFTTLLAATATLGVLTLTALNSWFERRVAALFQQRPGPNRVGPFGLFQPVADAVKLIFKEDITPLAANRFVHFLAPVLSITLAVLSVAVLPFARGIAIFDANIGVLFFLGVSSIAVYSVTLAGWSSNSKYALLGGLRSSAQMISYELGMGLAVVSVILLTNALHPGESLRLSSIVEGQAHGWYVFLNPLGFLIFVTAIFAETNRAPFDLIEAEQELVGGYHTEYSSMKFGSFMLTEFMHPIIASAFISTLFLGGYLGPGEGSLYSIADWPAWLQVLWGLGWFMAKTIFFVFVFIWVRWTLPRFKYNQLMNLGWKVLIPLGVANLLGMAFVLYFLKA